MTHAFQDGDIVDVVIRRDDGTTVEERVDLSGLIAYSDVVGLEHYLYRPDNCTDVIPIEKVVGMKLVTPRENRPAAELEVG
jgi:hypothetical protein